MEELTLYYWPGACSLAAHIILEESGRPFETRKVNFAIGEQKHPSYLAINPMGRVPAIATTWGIITENPAVLPYLGAMAGGDEAMWPNDQRRQAICAEWLSWLASTVHVAYAHISRVERYADGEEHRVEVARKGVEACRALWERIEDRLGDGGWAVDGRYSVVDPYLQVFWNWGRGPRLRYDMPRDFPIWTKHARRLVARDAAMRAFRREGIAPP